MIYFIIFVLTIIFVILINKIKSDNKNLDKKIKDYEQSQKERKEFREWFNNQNFKAKNNNLKPKKKFYYGENWKKKKGDDYEFYIKKFYENEGKKEIRFQKGKKIYTILETLGFRNTIKNINLVILTITGFFVLNIV